MEPSCHWPNRMGASTRVRGLIRIATQYQSGGRTSRALSSDATSTSCLCGQLSITSASKPATWLCSACWSSMAVSARGSTTLRRKAGIRGRHLTGQGRHSVRQGHDQAAPGDRQRHQRDAGRTAGAQRRPLCGCQPRRLQAGCRQGRRQGLPRVGDACAGTHRVRKGSQDGCVCLTGWQARQAVGVEGVDEEAEEGWARQPLGGRQLHQLDEHHRPRLVGAQVGARAVRHAELAEGRGQLLLIQQHPKASRRETRINRRAQAGSATRRTCCPGLLAAASRSSLSASAASRAHGAPLATSSTSSTPTVALKPPTAMARLVMAPASTAGPRGGGGARDCSHGGLEGRNVKTRE